MRAAALVDLVERGADLGGGDAELLRELGGELVADVSAAAVAAELAPALAVGLARLSSADSTLDSEMPSSCGERLLERVAELLALALAVVAEGAERGDELVLGDAELLGGVGERLARAAAEATVARAAAEAVAGGLAIRVGVAAGESRSVTRLAAERVGPGGEHERAREGRCGLLGAWGHGGQHRHGA